MSSSSGATNAQSLPIKQRFESGWSARFCSNPGDSNGHIHRIEGERNDLDGAALSYEREIARVFGVLPDGPPPPFDLVLLGMGDRRTHCSPLPGTDSAEASAAVTQYVPAIAANRGDDDAATSQRRATCDVPGGGD